MCRRFVGTAMLLGLTGCMVGPDYQRPPIDVPEAWRISEKAAQAVGNKAWWEQYGDPVLNDLVKIALVENKDVKIAAARIDEYLGLYATSRAALLPQVGAGASAGRQRASETTGPVLLSETPGGSPTFNNFQLSLNASWEIDLWGKLRRATEAARANLLSTEEARRSVILTLIGSVTNSYINLRDLDRLLEVTIQTAESYRSIYNIIKLRYDHGWVAAMELHQAKQQYEQAASNIPLYEKAVAKEENNLSVLLGRNPGAIGRGRKIDDLQMPSIPEGLPSEILENRPDVRQAEQNLIAANANIGVARALYYPSISLTGLLGLQSSELSKLFHGPSKIWSFAVPVTAPLFTGGAIEGQVQTAEAAQQEALFRYQQIIQTAFREVNDALVDQDRTREQLAALNRQVDSLREYSRLAWVRYNEGYASYLDVTYSQNLLYGAELDRVTVQEILLQAYSNLYRAMGIGG
jgi:multidrug efflux system outer membrane protein